MSQWCAAIEVVVRNRPDNLQRTFAKVRRRPVNTYDAAERFRSVMSVNVLATETMGLKQTMRLEQDKREVF